MALGVILTPYGAQSPYGFYAEIAQARGGNGTYLSQHPYPTLDRFFYSRGEPAFYYDTQLGAPAPIVVKVKAFFSTLKAKLTGKPPAAPMPMLPRGDGAIPSDAEMVNNTQCYTPVQSGWINTQAGFVPGTWRFGWNPAGAYGPPSSLGDAIPPTATSAADVLAAINAHNEKMFRLQVVTAIAVATSAAIASYRQIRLMRREMRHRGR